MNNTMRLIRALNGARSAARIVEAMRDECDGSDESVAIAKARAAFIAGENRRMRAIEALLDADE